MLKHPIRAVATGDVVASQSLSTREQGELAERLREAGRFAFGDAPFEVFRGDSWQAYCERPEEALARAVAMRSYAIGKLGFDTRVGIGLGAVDTFRPEKISLSQGEAFALSGGALGELRDERRLAMAAPAALSPELLSAVCELLDTLVSSWTDKQAFAIALATTGAQQNELAARSEPPISAQAFGKRLASANWKRIKQALDATAAGIALALRDRGPNA